MRKKVLPKERDSELNSAIQNMIDGGVPSEDIDIFVSDFVNKYGVEDNTEKKKANSDTDTTTKSKSIKYSNKWSIWKYAITKTEYSNGTIQWTITTKRNKSTKG